MALPIVSTEEDLPSYDLRDLMKNTPNPNAPRAERGWDVGKVIADWLISERQRKRANGSITRHVNDEQDLPDAARAAVAMAANNGQQILGLQSGVVTQLNSDAGYRRQVEIVTMVYASLLYPLSYMIYRLAGTENIQVADYNTVLTLVAGKKLVFTHVWDEIAKQSNKTPEEACSEWFKELLNTGGVGGDNIGLSQANPKAEATFGSKARITVFIPPILGGRSTLSAAIRIHGGATISDFYKGYVDSGRMDAAMAEFLIAALRGKVNILVSGGTDTGKTTFIRVCSRYFSRDSMVVTIEDGPELYLDQKDENGTQWIPFVISLTTVVSARTDVKQSQSLADLVKITLRARPDRIIVGEVRGAEAADMVKAMTSGHEGSLTSIHAFSGTDAIAKGAGLMTEDPRYTNNFAHAMDDMYSSFELVVHLAKFYEKRVIQEIVVVSKGNSMPIYSMNESGSWRNEIDRLDNIPNLSLRRKLAPFFPDGFLPRTKTLSDDDTAVRGRKLG
jgi:Flp pilus assembly CpaF family ATPase